MIIDTIKNRDRYSNLHKNIAAALQFIEEHANDPDLKDGSCLIIPDEVTVHVLTKETHAREEAQMEIHKNFMDIHYIIQGAERCSISPLAEESVIEYSQDTDNGFWDCKDTYDILIREGEFYAVWPMEPHCPLCNAGDQAKTIRKIICKVKVD